MNNVSDLFSYWFVRVKETYENDSSINVEDHVFRLDANNIKKPREQAKKYCIEKYGNLPFRKPKNAPFGTRYFYLTTSDKYWFDMWTKEHKMVCEFCGKEYIQVGSTRTSRLWDYRDKSLCSMECNLKYREKIMTEYNHIDNENYWVSEHDHPLTDTNDKNKELVGYIYKITNKRLMISYVGKTIRPPLFRWWQHLSVDDKFEQEDLTDLVFEVLEIIYYDGSVDDFMYGSAQEKLNQRERHYIDFFDTKNNGFNKV